MIHGDCIEKMKELEPNSVDAIVTDPPYGLEFMGKEWDKLTRDLMNPTSDADIKRKADYNKNYAGRRSNLPDYSNVDKTSMQEWHCEWAAEALRVLKPGGFLLAFGGTRTCHRLTCAIEDAGFEIRDMIAWVYGSGFPKSLAIGKAIDKLQGNERKIVDEYDRRSKYDGSNRKEHTNRPEQFDIGKSTITKLTKGTSEYEGWGTALKPALEPITVARKPLSEKTVAQNVLKWGTGGINIDSCRVETNEIKTETHLHKSENVNVYGKSTERLRHNGNGTTHIGGRFPANLIHDGSDEVEALFPDTKSGGNTKQYKREKDDFFGITGDRENRHLPSEGSASRFFYCAKASKKDRDEGLNGFEVKQTTGGGGMNDPQGDDVCGKYGSVKAPSKNNHPTVKPTKLMQYLVRLVTPKGGTVLDPFAGSGSTGKACKFEGFNFIGIEKEKEYFDIAEARIKAAEPELKLEI